MNFEGMYYLESRSKLDSKVKVLNLSNGNENKGGKP
jgi:hypothetical protein